MSYINGKQTRKPVETLAPGGMGMCQPFTVIEIPRCDGRKGAVLVWRGRASVKR